MSSEDDDEKLVTKPFKFVTGKQYFPSHDSVVTDIGDRTAGMFCNLCRMRRLAATPAPCVYGDLDKHLSAYQLQ